MHIALSEARRAGFSAFFTTMPQSVWRQLRPALGSFKAQEAPASIYGYQLPLHFNWWIDTADI